MRESINSRLLNKLGTKVAEQNLPPRSDLQIVDLVEIDPLKCNVLIAFERQIGSDPTLSQIERFISATFHNKVVSQSETAAFHDVDSAISVCLTMNCDTRPVTDATVMSRVAGNGYFDPSTGNIWQVVDNGVQKHLIRRTDENIAEIVQAKLERSSRKHATFAKIRQAAPMLTVGDRVRFYDGTLPVVGKISSISGDSVSISANGKSISVSKESVFNVIERSPTSVSSDKSTVEDYFARAFGNSDFASKLTRKMNRQESGANDTGWSGTVGDNKASED